MFAQQLKAIDNEIKDGVVAALIFASLPDFYKPLIMALENCGADLTTDLIKERLLAESARFENVGKETALSSRTRPFKKGSSKFHGKFFNCDKVGHRSAECRAAKKSVREKSETGLMSQRQLSTSTAL
ncbi:uncharacterized protein LOC129944819 [Eupeodes corollae]|uniref:uncharacterized protein LOC129944819 n=1 Tax=Eupeodes corollae TaxID=290404 RepID=UPI0024910C9B|nr:uncharacterized protein LOC129944819 [Eupeodes corollae]